MESNMLQIFDKEIQFDEVAEMDPDPPPLWFKSLLKTPMPDHNFGSIALPLSFKILAYATGADACKFLI